MSQLPTHTYGQFMAQAPFLADPYVDMASTLSVPAALRCATFISETVALCDLEAYDGFMEVEIPWLEDPLPPFYTVTELVAEITLSLVVNGNAYLLIVRDGAGQVTGLVPLPTKSVTVRIVNGAPVYEFAGNQIPASELVHFRGTTVSGSWLGLGVVENARKTIALGLSQQRYQSNSLNQGGVPSVIINVPSSPQQWSADIAQQIQEDWIASFSGANVRKPAVAPSGFTATPLSFSPEDMEFLESSKYNDAQICWLFGLDPGILGLNPGGSDLTYANLDQLNTARLRSVAIWMKRIESKLQQIAPQGVRICFNAESVLRTSTTERYAAHSTALAAGFLTKDEVRAIEGLPPLPAESPDPEPPTIDPSSQETDQ